MKKLLFFWKELLSTFWFVPVLIICLSLLSAIGLVALDNSIILPDNESLQFFIVSNSDSARVILSTISSAMISVAGTVFSVTLVALTLASSQFGPRLIKNFMYVRLNQVVLGSFVSTYLYCLLVLNTIIESNGYAFIPSLSIAVAILATIVNIVLLILFIHRIAMSIQADHIISEISDLISSQVGSMFPEQLGDSSEEPSIPNSDEILSNHPKKMILKSPQNGYLQYIDGTILINTASKNDCIIELFHRPGSFLVKGEDLGRIHSKSDIEESLSQKTTNLFIIGKTKTPQQDLEFSIHQMVEIAVRALSPGVNDPFTAIACIDNLTATLSYLASVRFPSKYRVNDAGELRVIADVIDFAGVLDASFNQIRQFSAGSPSVIIRLMERLETILCFTKRQSYRKAVLRHVDMVLNLGEETIKEKNDLNDLMGIADRIRSEADK